MKSKIKESKIKQRKFKQSKGDMVFNTVNTVLLLLIAFITLYPFWNLLIVSFNDSINSVGGNIYFWPRMFSLENYRSILSNNSLIGATLISLLRTIIGTISSVFCTMMLAYTLSRKEYVFRKYISALFVFTMFFSGGLIPSYMLNKSLGFIGAFSVYIIPGLISAFNVIVARSFIQELPDSIIESARIDSAGDFKIFLSIILPLSLPVMATLALFTSVGHWNDWFTTFLYNSRSKDLHVLQYKLMEMLQAANQLSGSAADAGSYAEMAKAGAKVVTPQSMRAAMTILVTLPILLVYPFLQKYFVKGFTLGGVKE